MWPRPQKNLDLIVCRYKPNRSIPRQFSKSDAIRVLCAVLAASQRARGGRDDPGDVAIRDEGDSIGTLFPIGGAFDNFERDLQAITAEVRARCGPPDPGRPRIEEQASASAAIATLELAEREASANSGMLGNLVDLLTALLTFLGIVVAIARFVPIPAVRVASVAATRLLSRVDGFRGTILARKASNDAAWTIYQRQIQALKQAA